MASYSACRYTRLGNRPHRIGEQLMDPAPTTLRPSDPLEKAKQMLGESDQGAVLVTDSDGKLLGAFFGANDDQEPGRKQELPDTEVWS
jgi:CBS-domain-containing membrane protein